MYVGTTLIIGRGTIHTTIPIGTEHIITTIGIAAITTTIFATSTAMITTPTSTEACPPEQATYVKTQVAFQEPDMLKATNWQEV